MWSGKFNVVSFSFKRGGAAIAAKKFSDILKNSGCDISLISQDDAGVFMFLKRLLSHLLVLPGVKPNSAKFALNLFSYPPLVKKLKSKQKDIFHFHWISNDTLSVFDFNKIPCGSIITLHDEWMYCADEHYYDVFATKRLFVDGYPSNIFDGLFFNLKYLVWSTKRKHFSTRDDIIFTVPSRWMYDRASQSKILKNARIRILPNPIDTDVFSPLSAERRVEERKRLGFDDDDFLFIFGAVDSTKNPLKGGQYLLDSLSMLAAKLPESSRCHIKLIFFGGDRIEDEMISSFHCKSVGHIKEPAVLSVLYAISDCVVVPSLVESFGQVAAEGQSCGTPAIAFNASGLKDVIIDGHTGRLAEPYSADSLSTCMAEIYGLSAAEREVLSCQARSYVIENFSYSVIRDRYFSVIEESKDIIQSVSLS